MTAHSLMVFDERRHTPQRRMNLCPLSLFLAAVAVIFGLSLSIGTTACTDAYLGESDGGNETEHPR